MKEAFEIRLKVRDYECDIQGVVNNGVYQNYLEHARHEFLLSKGIDFVELAKKGINLVVLRAVLDYKSPLRSGDEFYVKVRTEQSSRLRFDFIQNIYRLPDQKLVVEARITGTALNEKGKPFAPEGIFSLLLPPISDQYCDICSFLTEGDGSVIE